MLKRFLLLVGLLSLGSPAFAAGTIPFSLSQQFDSLGHVLAGCQLYTIQAGTTSTPQSAYQDSALTIALPNPQTCDASGRLPQMFLADGTIKVRLTDRNGVSQVVADNIQVIGASSGGGGGGTVDPTTILATGDFKMVYGTGVLTGFVRCNGRTIGSATSGATERANSDTQSLFQNFWTADPNLAVSGGRGASANADWVANKTLALPDCRGRVMANLPDMGNSAASWLSSTYFGATLALGAVSTTTDHVTLGTTNLPPYTPSGTIIGTVASMAVNMRSASNSGSNDASSISNGNTGGSLIGQLALNIGPSSLSGTFIGSAQGGSSTPFSSVQPTILVTTYIKL